TETENQTYNAGIILSPHPRLSLSTNYSRKATKIIRDWKLERQERRKETTDSKISYQAFAWGTLIYGHQHERNGGEVQAGAVADLDLEKTTQTLSLNINIPVDNPVLSSFVFTASLKQVDYRNNKNRDDDFRASLSTFEGTLNF
ncbi:hypothetical protein AMJ44_13205, partial [candidate division WOR-1 bacterium DG_54_3]